MMVVSRRQDGHEGVERVRVGRRGRHIQTSSYMLGTVRVKETFMRRCHDVKMNEKMP